jgi:hypothetical protein
MGTLGHDSAGGGVVWVRVPRGPDGGTPERTGNHREMKSPRMKHALARVAMYTIRAAALRTRPRNGPVPSLCSPAPQATVETS